MSTPKVFGIYGKSDSGKTTLLVQLVTRLTKEGYRVATVKQTDKEISMDVKEKDTWRHHQAGAQLVVFSSRKETNFLFDTPLMTAEIVRKISDFGSVDFIFIEGADDPEIQKIQVGSGRKRNNTIAVYKDNFQKILLLIKKEKKVEPCLSDLTLKVNGKNIPLTEFPIKIISSTILGMLSSLKKVEDIKTVSLELKR